MKKRHIICTSSALFGLTLLTGSFHKTLASSYYYTDSDYERSSTYAGITDNNSIKTVNINNTKKDVVYTTQDKDAKKVYSHCTAGVLRIKDSVLDQVTTLGDQYPFDEEDKV